LQCKIVIFVLGCVIFTLSSCRRDSELHSELGARVSQKVAAAEAMPSLHPCPEAPYPMLKAKDPVTGHHKVYLRWNASTSASGKDPNAFGYCLYRTQKPGRAKDCPKNYPTCEQVNVVPVRGTRCVDELVRDGTTYYYVAIAINSSSTSTTSDEAIADVPIAGKRNPAPPDAASYPVCRIPVPSRQAPSR
jgi:hypothetical protein